MYDCWLKIHNSRGTTGQQEGSRVDDKVIHKRSRETEVASPSKRASLVARQDPVIDFGISVCIISIIITFISCVHII